MRCYEPQRSGVFAGEKRKKSSDMALQSEKSTYPHLVALEGYIFLITYAYQQVVNVMEISEDSPFSYCHPIINALDVYM